MNSVSFLSMPRFTQSGRTFSCYSNLLRCRLGVPERNHCSLWVCSTKALARALFRLARHPRLRFDDAPGDGRQQFQPILGRVERLIERNPGGMTPHEHQLHALLLEKAGQPDAARRS